MESEKYHGHVESNVAVEDKSPTHSELAEGDWTAEEEVAVRRKLDWHIVPLVTLLYLLCFLDRANIGNARIQGMAKELKLVGYRFNWALSIFYITYVFVEVPSNIILRRIGPRFWIPFLVMGFGFVSICTSFVKSFQGLCAARAFLGVFEGGTFPGIAFFLSCFYKRNELLFRVGIYVSAASMAGAFGGLFATVLSRIPAWGVHSMRITTWRNIFFFEGILTVIVGGLAPIFMPTKPAETWFLNERERYIAHERLVREFKANPEPKVEWRHVKRAVMNVNNYVAALGFFIINITVQGMSVFMPTILNDLGWTNTKAQLYSVPVYVVACTTAIAIAFISDKTRLRGIYLALFTFLGITGFSLLRWHTNTNVRYMAVYFVAMGAFPGGPGFLSWALNNAAGPAVRAVSSGYIVTLGTLGGIVATWTYVPKDAPKYHTGHLINLSGQCVVFFLSCFGIAYCLWENRQREKGKRDYRLQGLTPEEERDLGHHHPSFRYIP